MLSRFLPALLLALAGCTSAGVEVTPNTRPLVAGEYESLGRTSGSSTAGYFFILNFIPIHFGPNDCAGAARDAALEEKPGADALIDTVADRSICYIPIPIVSVSLTITEVEGEAVKTHTPKPAGGGK